MEPIPESLQGYRTLCHPQSLIYSENIQVSQLSQHLYEPCGGYSPFTSSINACSQRRYKLGDTQRRGKWCWPCTDQSKEDRMLSYENILGSELRDSHPNALFCLFCVVFSSCSSSVILVPLRGPLVRVLLVVLEKTLLLWFMLL